MRGRRIALLAAFAASLGAGAPARRVVILKVDGLGQDVLNRYLSAKDPLTGKSRLPWIDYIFSQHGARMDNFYVRGISLSVPSWSMLDSGHYPVIRGNAEYDRVTMRVYDYLNFFPFYFSNARHAQADMPAVQVMDEAGLPLLIDYWAPAERLQSMQLYQRGVRWRTLGSTLPRRFSRDPRQLFDEWQVGFQLTNAVAEQQERELIAALADDRRLYLDLFIGDYDHTAHLTNDERSTLAVLQKLDHLIGRIQGAIEQSPLARQTLLVLISDHGMNTSPNVYSQGYNLINFFGSAEGGGHHVLTNRHPESEYKLKGLDPFVSRVVTPSRDSFYLKDEASDYPTALMDLDGNERAAIYLRNSDINALHILLKQPRAASAAAVMRILDANRAAWRKTTHELDEELAALERAVQRRRATLWPEPKHLTKEQYAAGVLAVWVRRRAEIDLWDRQLQSYREYRRWLETVLDVREEDIASGKVKTEALIPRERPFSRNSIYQLTHYVVNAGAKPAEFASRNYFELLTSIRVRNNVQPGVSARPIDFVAVDIPLNAVVGELSEDERPDGNPIWLYGGKDRQLLILPRRASRSLRCLPVRDLKQDRSGRVTFTRIDYTAGLPLEYFEDPALDLHEDRAGWLAAWHTETEWLRAVHQTRYSNGVIGVAQQFASPQLGDSPVWERAGGDEPVLRRFVTRLREMAAPDLLLLASDHWNFNVRGFNPGGNHGSFFRISTHSVLMMAGAGIPDGLVVERPYDSMSFVPTVLALTGRGAPETYPGPPIEELLPPPAQ